jgi:hypothetical protein
MDRPAVPIHSCSIRWCAAPLLVGTTLHQICRRRARRLQVVQVTRSSSRVFGLGNKVVHIIVSLFSFVE